MGRGWGGGGDITTSSSVKLDYQDRRLILINFFFGVGEGRFRVQWGSILCIKIGEMLPLFIKMFGRETFGKRLFGRIGFNFVFKNKGNAALFLFVFFEENFWKNWVQFLCVKIGSKCCSFLFFC